MRLYEFSKQCGLPAKDLIDLLRKNGFDVKSHMSSLSEEALNFLTKETSKKPQEDIFLEQQSQTGKAKVNRLVEQPSITPEKKTDKQEIKKEIPAKPVEKIEKKGERTPFNPARERKSLSHAAMQSLPEQPIEAQEIYLEPISVGAFAEKIAKPVNDVILTLLKLRVIATKNQLLPVDVVEKLAKHYMIKTAVKPIAQEKDEIRRGEITVADGAVLHDRSPIVVVLGHVDHGKTTLLDYIRKTRVAAKEKGGITQHLGAYEASTDRGTIVFLDTPGHEAFTRIRQRGVRIADIAVLVVAADDGVMPQTVEAIKQIKSMNIPLVVAINKIDKVDATRLEVIKRQLSQHDVLPEEWGGQAVCVPISAKTGNGVDQLLEILVLQAQLMELKANYEGFASGYLLETKLEKGRGIVATLISQQGTLHIGDYFTAGNVTGRVTLLLDSHGKRLTEIKPFLPVQISGFDELPNVGDFFQAVSKQDYLHAKSRPVAQQAATSREMGVEKRINIIIKADNASSKEALLGSIEKLNKKLEVTIHPVMSGIGNINESDIELAQNTDSIVVGLHIKAESNAIQFAREKKVTIVLYDIIYKLLEALEEKANSLKAVKMIRTKIGEAIVRKVFDIPGVGVVAGSYVRDGRFSREGLVVIWRGKYKVGEGKITGLQRDKKAVKEVHAGFECGFVVDQFSEWLVDDRVECFIDIPQT